MKKIKRKIGIAVLAVLCVSLLCACGNKGSNGGSDANTTKIADDVAVEDIATKVESAMALENEMSTQDANYIQGMMKMDVSNYAEYIVKVNAFGTNIDEFGIFKGKDADQTAEISQAVSDYLKMRNDTWMTEYMPEERPKMEAASYEVCGNYVMYCILDDAAKTTAFNTFKSALGA